MKFSKKISEEMEKKNDRLAQIKKIGVHDCCGRTSKVIAFYESMTKSGLMSHHLVFGCVNGTTVFFTLTEDEVIEKIREIPDKEAKRVPKGSLLRGQKAVQKGRSPKNLCLFAYLMSNRKRCW